MNSIRSSSYFTTKRGVCLFRQNWIPKNKEVKAVVFLWHGYAEHSARYSDFADSLCKEGFAVYAMDNEGHGRSDGQQAYFNDYKDLVEDFLEYVSNVRGPVQSSDLPYFLFGHSFGGSLGLYLASESKSIWTGILLTGPAINISSNMWKKPIACVYNQIVPKFIKSFIDSSPLWYQVAFVDSLVTSFLVGIQRSLAFLTAGVLPSAPVNKISPDKLCRNPEVIKKYMEDPFILHGWCQAQPASQIMKLSNDLFTITDKLQELPIIIYHGSEDDITSLSASEQFFNQLKTFDKTFKKCDGMMHELLWDREGSKVTGDIIRWIHAHC